jgi:uncharacterized membrane protein HdeD (DUF308 family)
MMTTLIPVAKTVWWMLLLRGILAIVFGIIALIAPGAALTGIAIIFGIYAIVDGVTEFGHVLRTPKGMPGRGWLVFQGVVSILAGLAAIILPGLAGVVGGLLVLWTIVAYSIVHGAMGTISAAGASSRAGGSSQRAGSGRAWGIASGVITLLFGILLGVLVLVTPGATLLGLIWTVGVYAIVFGLVLIVAAFQLRRALRTAIGGATA